MYNNTYRLKEASNGIITWSEISSPNTPKPRSSHQAVASRSHVYISGGEFTSPSQMQFYHHRVRGLIAPCFSSAIAHLFLFSVSLPQRLSCMCSQDMWRLDVSTMKWQELSCKGGPTPRSGHRAILW